MEFRSSISLDPLEPYIFFLDLDLVGLGPLLKDCCWCAFPISWLILRLVAALAAEAAVAPTSAGEEDEAVVVVSLR